MIHPEACAADAASTQQTLSPEGQRQRRGAIRAVAVTAVAGREPGKAGRRGIARRHVLMLLLALEVLVLGVSNADRYRKPPVVTVDTPSTFGHVIT